MAESEQTEEMVTVRVPKHLLRLVERIVEASRNGLWGELGFTLKAGKPSGKLRKVVTEEIESAA